MHIGFHHFLKRHTAQQVTNTDGVKKNLDRFIYIVTPLTVLIFIPQLLKIWVEKSTAGLSLISWIGMMAGSLFWLVYGAVHREKPMVVINIALGIIQFFIVVGIVIYK